ncbi:MAG: RtcB family protein [Deltaproteobacteria bacterium]|nr:RtcB family protein [Deltaproteobacteria bacterium]
MQPGIEKVTDYCFRIPKTGAMRVPGIIYATEEMMDDLKWEGALKQVANVATLPGIVKASMAMPDIHLGYGFPIGGVAAFDWDEGIISPGGVGYDINCGVRLAATKLEVKDLEGKLPRLADDLFRRIPSGVGSTGFVKLTEKEARKVLVKGAQWALEQGMGEPSDIEHTEEHGAMAGADPEAVSERAIQRGFKQLGTLGSGNHFLEVGAVEEIYDPAKAEVFGLSEGQVTVFVHSGSRGLGYQVCDDFLAIMTRKANELPFELPDRQLACAYIGSDLGRRYFSAMAAAANYAWANRQILMHHVRQGFMEVLDMGPRDLGMRLIYDVCHNVAKKERHTVDGEERTLCVHRKGATRAFGPGRPEVPSMYRAIGQPVLVPGDMGRYSYLMCGTQGAMDETFGSACHGAGRVLSRTAAKKASRGRDIAGELAGRGILVRWTGRSTLMEEVSEAYKDVSLVVETVAGAGLAVKVARLRPLAVVKG